MKCPKCNTENEGYALYCVSCHTKLRESIQQQLPPIIPNIPEKSLDRREPFIAGILSFFWIGLGQAYNGQRRKGYIFFVCLPLLGIFYFVLHRIFNEPIPKEGESPSFNSPSYMIASVFFFCVWLFNIYDAYNSAKRINEGAIVIDSTPGKSAFIFLRNVILSAIAFFILMPSVLFMLFKLFKK